MAFFYGLWENLTFGKYLQFLINFVQDNFQILGVVIFIYVVIIFIGRYGGSKYIPDKYEEYVINRSKELKNNNPKISKKQLIDNIYSGWNKEIEKFPNYIFIKSKRDYWVEKPTLENIENRLDINKDSLNDFLIQHGVIMDE